ncbi:unnamed protein product, partial [Mesorhabditis belari]|uniref:Uncharacterized protein n=1 Tax=Mesorhabditis belari TaxID=2138241 RepID=A0AAF3FAT5_9BILA
MFRASKVLKMLVDEFGLNSDSSAPTRQEVKLKGVFSRLLHEAESMQIVVEEEDETMECEQTDDLPDEWDSDEDWQPTMPTTPNAYTNGLRIGDRIVEKTQLDKALEFYRGATTGVRTRSCIHPEPIPMDTRP